MTASVKRIMLKEIRARLSQGEDLKTILDSYPKLPYADKKELKKELSE